MAGALGQSSWQMLQSKPTPAAGEPVVNHLPAQLWWQSTVIQVIGTVFVGARVVN